MTGLWLSIAILSFLGLAVGQLALIFWLSPRVGARPEYVLAVSSAVGLGLLLSGNALNLKALSMLGGMLILPVGLLSQAIWMFPAGMLIVWCVRRLWRRHPTPPAR